jgi:hypothetical protein
MALIPIYCSNESCKHLGFVSVETLPRVLTCSSCGHKVCTHRRQSAPRKIANLPSANGDHIISRPRVRAILFRGGVAGYVTQSRLGPTLANPSKTLSSANKSKSPRNTNC